MGALNVFHFWGEMLSNEYLPIFQANLILWFLLPGRAILIQER